MGNTQGCIAAMALFAFVMTAAYGQDAAETGLQCVQKPMFWFPGQQTRIMIATPADCGELKVTYPEQIELFARWPHRAGDTTQRFYFRALAPVDGAALSFSSGDYTLSVPIAVHPWSAALTAGSLEINGLRVPRIFPIDGEDEAKAGPSFVTSAELDALRAEGIGGEARANELAAILPADHDIFLRLPETTLPRAVFVQSKSPKGCPICGRKIFEGRSPFYPWVLDYENHPYQVQCPECERWFPDNDFAAGDMSSGEYPDDGWAYIDPTGDPYGFVSYYTMRYYMSQYYPNAFKYAGWYARSGDRRFGHTAALMMFRIAEQYLNLALNINQRKAYMRNAVWNGQIIPQDEIGMYNTWFYIEHNWECPIIPKFAEAFDQVWDYFGEDDPALIAFLQQNHHPEIQSMADVRSFIETGYFRVVAQGCIDRTLIGNHPQAQRAAMETALLLNTPRAYDIVDWTFNGDGGMRYFLTNEFFIDGSAFESPSYNRGHYVNTQSVADVLNKIVALNPERYANAGFPLLTDDPKYKLMYDFNIGYSLLGRTCADVGDSGDVAGTDPIPPGRLGSLSKADFIPAFTRFPEDVNFARALWDATTEQPVKELVDQQLRDQVTAIIQRDGAELNLDSSFLDGYGHAILRSGRGDDARTLWVRWGELYGHRHDDMLTMGFEAKQRILLPELGYPHSWTFRNTWENNRLTHYSPRIAGLDEGVRELGGGSLRLFADGAWAKMACAGASTARDVAAPRLHEIVDQRAMERTIALVDIDAAASYGVTIVRLSGGTDHYLGFHGPRGEGTPEAITLQQQSGGTLAGSEIAYDDRKWAAENPLQAPFTYIYDVARARPTTPWSIDWALEKYPDIHLRMHDIAPDTADVGIGKGKPPGGGNPYELVFTIHHRRADEAPAQSRFASVLECYEGEPAITQVRPIQVSSNGGAMQAPIAFEVVIGDRVDTIVQCHDPSVSVMTETGIAMTGAFGVWSEVGGRMRRALLVDGLSLTKGDVALAAEQPSYVGTIASADFANRKVTVQPAPANPVRLLGRHARITSEFGNDCSHLIVGVEQSDAGCVLELELDPRTGEGPVERIENSHIVSGFDLVFGPWRYYHGKTVANEDASVAFKVSGVSGNANVFIHPDAHPDVSREQLEQAFSDVDGDGHVRFVIYDYGVGDTITVPNVVSVERDGGE